MNNLSRLELANILRANLDYLNIPYTCTDVRYRSYKDDCYKSSYRFYIPKSNGRYSVVDVLDDVDVKPYEQLDYYQIANDSVSTDVCTILDTHHSGYIHIPRTQ